MTRRTLPSPWKVWRGNVFAFLGALLALMATTPSVTAQPADTPAFKPTPGSSLPFAALAIGVGVDPAIAPLSLAGLHAVDESSLSKDSRGQTLLGISALLGVGDVPAAPLTELAVLKSGDSIGCWTLVNTDLARPIPSLFLTRFRDLSPLPDLASNVHEYDALSYILLLAARNSPAAFQTSAAVNQRVTYAALFQQPHVHRGKPVRVEGNVQWINKLDTPSLLKEAGVADLYELWIVNLAASATPYSVLLTELPADLAVGKRIDVPVTLDGYFLKRRREAGDAVKDRTWRESLLLAGRSVTVQKLLALMVTGEGRRAVGATTLMMSGAAPMGVAPLTEVTLLDHGERVGCWTLVNSDIVRPIPKETLAKIKHGKTLAASASEGLEFDALLEVLQQTWHTSPRAFEKAARKDLSFSQLFQNPTTYHGEVVHIEGRLRLVQRWDPPLMAREAGVPPMYEVAIFDDASGSNPYIVLVMEVPEGIPLNEKISEKATVDGYYFKKWRYKSLDSTKETEFRDAPLIIGRSLKVRKGANAPAAGTGEPPMWALTAGAIGIAVLTVGVAVMFAMAFWLRRGDARVQEKLHAVRTNTFIPPPPDDHPPLATPVNPPK